MAAEINRKLKLSDETRRSKKKAMAILLGNTGDVIGLQKMLDTESDEIVILHIITVLGSMANVEVIPSLNKVKEKNIGEKVAIAIDNAIETIRKHSGYS